MIVKVLVAINEVLLAFPSTHLTVVIPKHHHDKVRVTVLDVCKVWIMLILKFSAFSDRALSSGVIQNLYLTRLNIVQLLGKVKWHVASVKPVNMISAQNAVT